MVTIVNPQEEHINYIIYHIHTAHIALSIDIIVYSVGSMESKAVHSYMYYICIQILTMFICIAYEVLIAVGTFENKTNNYIAAACINIKKE